MNRVRPTNGQASGQGAPGWVPGPALGLALAVVAGGMLATAGESVVWTESFDTPPAARGWRVFGDGDLFQWDRQVGALWVRWDSRKPNSYFYRPLATELNRADAFSLEFDLRLERVEAGINPAKPFTFELAVGFHRRADAEAPGFRRGTGTDATNLVELAWFPDTGYGATLWPTLISREGRFNYTGSTDFRIVDLQPGVTYRLRLAYAPDQGALHMDVLADGQPLISGHQVPLAAAFTDFRVDTVAVRSYSDEGAQGSLLAEGWIDNLRVETPPPPASAFRIERGPAGWQAAARVAAGWQAALERTTDWVHWEPVGPPQPGGDEERTWPVDVGRGAAFYRLRVERP